MESAMGLAKRLLGVFLIAVAVAVVLALAVNLCRKICLTRASPTGPLPGGRWHANLSFYGSLVLTAWFFWNWFHSFLPENEPALVGEIHLAAWMWINPLFFLVCGVTGLHRLREARRG